MKRILSVLLVVMIIASMSTATALGYTAGTLPGGTSIEVDNTQPTDGEVFYIPAGETSIDITYEGTASVGEGVTIANTTLIYVIDASGSTRTGVLERGDSRRCVTTTARGGSGDPLAGETVARTVGESVSGSR